MSAWITQTKPTADDACKDESSLIYECVIVPGYDYMLYRKWYAVLNGEAWKPYENEEQQP